MAFEYRYAVYNPGQYAADVADQWDALVTDGWQVHTAMPNYSEIAILWHREIPKAEVKPDKPAKDQRAGA